MRILDSMTEVTTTVVTTYVQPELRKKFACSIVPTLCGCCSHKHMFVAFVFCVDSKPVCENPDIYYDVSYMGKRPHSQYSSTLKLQLGFDRPCLNNLSAFLVYSTFTRQS